jgi:hypothetical protein
VCGCVCLSVCAVCVCGCVCSARPRACLCEIECLYGDGVGKGYMIYGYMCVCVDGWFDSVCVWLCVLCFVCAKHVCVCMCVCVWVCCIVCVRCVF